MSPRDLAVCSKEQKTKSPSPNAGSRADQRQQGCRRPERQGWGAKPITPPERRLALSSRIYGSLATRGKSAGARRWCVACSYAAAMPSCHHILSAFAALCMRSRLGRAN